MSVKKTTYIIEVNTQNGKVQIDGLTKGFVDADIAARRLNTTMRTTSKSAGQVASKAGLAGAAVTEIGRTISDSNFGMMAMANNLQQLSTLMVTLIATSGGVAQGFKEIWKALMGPLGLILVFQTFIAILERQDQKQRQAASSANKLSNEMEKLAESYVKAEKASSGYAVTNAELRASEQELAELRLEEPGNFRKIAAKREEIITKRIQLLLREREAVRGLSVERFDKLTNEIADLRAERERILREEFGKREKIQGVDGLEAFGLAPITEDAKTQLIDSAADTFSQLFDTQQWANNQAIIAERDKAEAMRVTRENEKDHALMMYDAIGVGAQAMGGIIGEETAAGKAVAIAGTLINTYAAIAGQLKAFSGVGIPGYAIAQAIATGLVGFEQVRRIIDVQVPGGRRGGSGASGQSSSASSGGINPSFNIVGTSNASQLREAVEGQLDRPVQAYVTTKQVRSGEELDRNIRGGASFG